MATASYSCADALTLWLGNYTDESALSRNCRRFTGANTQLTFIATGTALTINYYSSGNTTSIRVSVDGGADVTPTLTTGSWQTLTIFTGLADTAHTVVIKDNGIATALNLRLDTTTTGLTVTGASPSISANPAYSTPIAVNYSGVANDTGVSVSGFPQTEFVSALTNQRIRFTGSVATVKGFFYSNNHPVRLWVDNVPQSIVTLGTTNTYEVYQLATGLDTTQQHTYYIEAEDINVHISSFMVFGGTGISSTAPPTRKKLLTFGDSITHGTYGTAGDGGANHTALLANLLCMQPINQGIDGTLVWSNSGANANAGETRASSTVSTLLPDYMIVLYGVNDANQNGGAESAATFQTSYSNMISAIATASPATKVFCLGILNTDNSAHATAYANRSSFNAAIQAAVTALANSNFKYISTDNWINPATDTLDGIHPNATGYKKFAAAFMQASGFAAKQTLNLAS